MEFKVKNCLVAFSSSPPRVDMARGDSGRPKNSGAPTANV